MQTTTLTITDPRLQPATITVTAESTAEIALYTPPGELASTWYTLLIDGRHYYMIQWKHLTGQIAATEALDRALCQVRQAIASLQPPPTPYFDAMVAAVLERMAEENTRSAELAESKPDLKDDAAFFRRAVTAYTNALIGWQKGVRPVRTASGNYLLPSRRPGESPHLLRLDGDWICNCRARSCMHWPIAMMVALEIAQDDQDRFDDDDYSEVTAPDLEPPGRAWATQDGTHEDTEAAARQALIRRLCAVRARLLAA